MKSNSSTKRTKKKKSNPDIIKVKKNLITRLVKEPNWPREMKIANKLFKEMEDLNFWNSVNLDYKLNSLAFFLTDRGAEIIRSKKRVFDFVFPDRQKYTLQEDKIDEDIKINPEVKNLIDFYCKNKDK